MHPYRGEHFFGFFVVLLKRLVGFLRGEISELATDEIQLLVLVGVAISAALVGCFLVLRRMTMVANSLSHTILLGIVLAYLLLNGHTAGYGEINVGLMVIAAALMGVVTTILTQFLHQTGRLPEDASIGLIFTSLFALGIFLVTLYTRNLHLGLEVVMGNADALTFHDVKLIGWILLFNLLLLLFLFRAYHLATFDPLLARSMGLPTALLNYLLMIQVSLTVVGGFRAVGVVMVLALIVGPPLIARRFVKGMRSMLLLAAAIGSLAAILGVAIARHCLSAYNLPLSTGGLVVCCIVALFLLGSAIPRRRISTLQLAK